MKQLKTFSSIVTKADGNTVQGLWTVFNVIDDYGDRSHKGLAGNATPNSVRFMFNHTLIQFPWPRSPNYGKLARPIFLPMSAAFTPRRPAARWWNGSTLIRPGARR